MSHSQRLHFWLEAIQFCRTGSRLGKYASGLLIVLHLCSSSTLERITDTVADPTETETHFQMDGVATCDNVRVCVI